MYAPPLLITYAGERKRLVDKLVHEFPDVFAFPRMTTTRQPNEHSWYALTGAELEEHQQDLAALQEAQEQAGEKCVPALVRLTIRGHLFVNESNSGWR